MDGCVEGEGTNGDVDVAIAAVTSARAGCPFAGRGRPPHYDDDGRVREDGLPAKLHNGTHA